MKVKSESEVVQSCPTLSDPMDCSLPGSSVHGIFQARVLEWGAIAFSACVLCIISNHRLVLVLRFMQGQASWYTPDTPAVSDFHFFEIIGLRSCWYAANARLSRCPSYSISFAVLHLHKPPAPLPKWKLTSLSPKFNLNTTLKDKCHIHGSMHS